MIESKQLHIRDSLSTYDKSDRVSNITLSPMQKVMTICRWYKLNLLIISKAFYVSPYKKYLYGGMK